MINNDPKQCNKDHKNDVWPSEEQRKIIHMDTQKNFWRNNTENIRWRSYRNNQEFQIISMH